MLSLIFLQMYAVISVFINPIRPNGQYLIQMPFLPTIIPHTFASSKQEKLKFNKKNIKLWQTE